MSSPSLSDPGAAAGAPLPIGYTSDTLQNYYKSIINPIDVSTGQNVGLARSEALSRGLEGTPTETGGVAAARYGGDLAKASTLSGLAFNMAGLSNQDSLIKQQQDWQTGERKDTESFQANQNALDRAYNLDRDQNDMNTKNRFGYQSALWGLGANLAGRGMAAGFGI